MPDRRVDVSVLVAAYDCALTIRRAVASAVNQPGIVVQVCICHDAGPASAWGAVVQAAYEHAGVVTFRQHDANQGPGAAMQHAAEMATGRYLILLGDDDWLEPGCLKPLVYALDTDPTISFAYGATQYWGRRTELYVPPTFARQDFYTGFPSLYGYLFRREVWESGPGYRDEFEREGRWLGAPDWDMALQCIEAGDGACLPDVLVLNHLLVPGRMTEIVGRRGADVLASLKARWPKLEAETV